MSSITGLPEGPDSTDKIRKHGEDAAAEASKQSDIVLGAGVNTTLNGVQDVHDTLKHHLHAKQIAAMDAAPPVDGSKKSSGITFNADPSAIAPHHKGPVSGAAAPSKAPDAVGAPAPEKPAVGAPAPSTTDKTDDTSSLPDSIQGLVDGLTPEQVNESYYGKSLEVLQVAFALLAACQDKLSAKPAPTGEALSTIKDDINKAYTQLQNAEDILTKYPPGVNSSLAQPVQDVVNKLQAFLDNLKPPAADADDAAMQDWATKMGNQQTSAVSDRNMLFTAVITLGNEIDLPEPPLWSDVSKFILGSMMSKLEAHLSSAQALVAAETQMFNRIGSMMAQLVKWGIGDVAAPMAFTIPTVPRLTAGGKEDPEWVKFSVELSNLKKFKANGMNTWFANMQKNIVAMESNAKGHPSLEAHVNSLWAQLRNMKKVVSAVAGLKLSQFISSKGGPQKPSVFLFYTNADGKHVISRTPGGKTIFEYLTVKTLGGGVTKVKEPVYKGSKVAIGAKTLLKKFGGDISAFTAAVKNDHAAIEGYSNSAQANLRLQMMYMQELYQVGPQLIQTLAELAKAVAQHTDGK